MTASVTDAAAIRPYGSTHRPTQKKDDLCLPETST